LIAAFSEFSKTITQGDFGRGHVFVGQYLWETEGVSILGWMAFTVVCLWYGRQRETRRRLHFWLGAAALLYLGLVICADVLRVFVVYGRTARILVPFLCLAAAAAGEEIFSRRLWRGYFSGEY